MISGAAAGLVSDSVMHPIDTGSYLFNNPIRERNLPSTPNEMFVGRQDRREERRGEAAAEVQEDGTFQSDGPLLICQGKDGRCMACCVLSQYCIPQLIY